MPRGYRFGGVIGKAGTALFWFAVAKCEKLVSGHQERAPSWRSEVEVVVNTEWMDLSREETY